MKNCTASVVAALLALSIGEGVNAQPYLATHHAPIGVMGDHSHEAGEWMFSYRTMHMGMEGNSNGTNSVSSDSIVTNVANRFFGQPMQPPTLRVVPTSMTMDMHMLGAMYAPNDWLTLMAMGVHVTKKMRHVTYKGPAGTTQLGNFSTRSSGFGDATLGALLRVHQTEGGQLHFNLGISLPTGSNTETGTVLTPTGATPTLRLPYAMQSGAGTYNIRPGVTFVGASDVLSWGAQYVADVPLGKNSQSYAFGHSHMASVWVGYGLAPWISGSLRLGGEVRSDINGIDPNVIAPVQTADPSNYGGERLDLHFGINLAGQEGVLQGHRLGLEIGLPLYQDLNGPQMERDWTVTIGWQKTL